MKLTKEKNIKVAVELNGEKYITSEEGILFQNSESINEILLYIKSEDNSKEIKIKIMKF